MLVRDETSGASVVTPRKRLFQAISFVAATEAAATTIPKFTSIHYYNVSLNGQPLSAVSGVVRENMINKKSNIMVRTSGLTTDGAGFLTTFVRAG
jgi:hypothetical protein